MTNAQIDTQNRFLPAWTRQLKDAYASGTNQMFVVHGNISDFVRLERPEGVSYVMLSEFLATQVFGTFDAVLYFDIARGPRALATSPARLEKINQLIERFIGPVEQLRGTRAPAAVMAVLDKFLELALMRDADRPSIAIVLDYAHFLAPASSGGATSTENAAVLATLQNWARSPYFKRAAFAFVLLSERLSDLNDSLSHSAHTTRLEIPFPDADERRRYVEWSLAGRDHVPLSDFGPKELATLTGGLSLVNLSGLLQSAIRTGQRLEATRLKAFKKQMIEGQCQGLVEFVEPRHNLELVVGQEAAVARLKQDAELLLTGRLDAVPMGYLLTGSVGTGKTFLAECYAGSVGIPCVKLLNFRSKYVGETEGNLEKILKVLRVMGPVAVIIDEADAMLGNRGSGGDSGTSSRVFGQFATQMGNTAYRGRIIWFLLTCRPDLLPIDLKRQGRCEVHIPLFYPETDEARAKMFVAMGLKNDIDISEDEVPSAPQGLDLSGADIESIATAARRLALVEGQNEVSAAHLKTAMETFVPSHQTDEKELQELAAIIECTDVAFLPESLRGAMRDPPQRAELMRRFREVSRRVGG